MNFQENEQLKPIYYKVYDAMCVNIGINCINHSYQLYQLLYSGSQFKTYNDIVNRSRIETIYV